MARFHSASTEYWWCLCGGLQGHSQLCTKCYVCLDCTQAASSKTASSWTYCIPFLKKGVIKLIGLIFQMPTVEYYWEISRRRNNWSRKWMSSDTYERMRPVIKTVGEGILFLLPSLAPFLSCLYQSRSLGCDLSGWDLWQMSTTSPNLPAHSSLIHTRAFRPNLLPAVLSMWFCLLFYITYLVRSQLSTTNKVQLYERSSLRISAHVSLACLETCRNTYDTVTHTSWCT